MLLFMNRKKILTLMAVCSLTLQTSAWAAEKNGPAALEEFEMEDMLVTAQRMEKSELDTPAATTVITAKELEQAGYRNVFEAIDQQLGSTSTSYGEAGQDFGFSSGRVTLRGYDRGTLVLVNGVPMNLKNYSSTENIPIAMVERIEIVKGAASTLYGSQAMGGVINVILKKPAAGSNQGTVSTTYGNYFKKTETTYQGDNFMVDISRERSREIPHSNAFGIDKVSYTDWWVGEGQKDRVGLALKLTDELSFNYDYTQSDITRGGTKYKVSGNTLVPSTTKYSYSFDDYRQSGSFTYQGKDNGVKAVLGYNSRKVDGYDYIKKAKLSSNRKMDSETLDLQKEWKLDKDTFLAGYSFRQENAENTYSAQSATRSSNAIYSSYTKSFNDRLEATIGLRGEFINDPEKDQNVIMPQIQSVYKVSPDTSWYINIGKAFQMPDVDDVLTYNKINASNLKPEEGWTYETGWKHTKGADSWKLALYHMDMSNKVGWAKDINNEYYPINTGDFRNTGVEAEYKKKFDAVWSVKVGASLSNPEIKNPSSSTAAWVQDAARVEGLIGVDYQKEKWAANMNLKYLGDREYYAASASSGLAQDIPDKLQLNMNFNYQCDRDNSLSLGLYNLLNRDNYSNRYGNLDLPRNYRLTFTHNF